MTSYMTKLGVTERQSSTKKKMHRNLEKEFGNSLDIFPDEKGRLLMVPNNLTIQNLVKQHAQLKD